MSSKIVPVRLNEEEQQMLTAICRSAVSGDLTPSEKIRQLIHREFNRRQGLEKPDPSDYTREFRTGRPAAKCTTV